NGDAETFEEILNDELFDSISYFDSAESFYHGFLLGLLRGATEYILLSNRESGLGRCDVIMKFETPRGKAVIFEFKLAKKMNQLEDLSLEALNQIEYKKYVADLIDEGYKPEKIFKYGIAFCGKVCAVKGDMSQKCVDFNINK
ncbi:MAG: PD-(D/E)XK nuclease domain-containing protein, partial [Dysgonamonadaceae bacterium]|nr:PD-(D/E)XK nuclease domain-containing protein [Dysgonamonadaceae bacterium]